MTDSVAHTHTPIAAAVISRRTFIAAAGVLAAGTTFFALRQEPLLGLDASFEELVATLQRSQFARYIGDAFRLSLAEGAEQVTLHLTSVSDLEQTIKFATEEQTRAYHEASFSILLRGPAGLLLRQGTYLLTHHRIGLFSLFIVPAGADEQGQYYQAIFNRLPA
jgi:hypothetical protein